MTQSAAWKSRSIWLGCGFIAGLFIRHSMLFYPGVSDMIIYYHMGKEALATGLSASYQGIYFPLQYQIFEICAWTVSKSAARFFTVYKLASLAFDIGSFCLLILLLRRSKANPLYAMVYWLHPWFLAVFSLGYCDFHFTFFILLCVLFLRRHCTADFLLAGIPLGLAFLMKPQTQILVVATFVYGVLHYVRTRNARPFAMLAGPIFLFLGYEIYFVQALPSPHHLAAWFLPAAYLNVTNIMPALTGQMTNIWYPIAFLMKQPQEPIFAISDQIHLLPYISAKYLAAAVVLGLVGLYILRIEREDQDSIADKFTSIFCFAAMTVPFLMTSGHENHLFLGTVLLILFLAKSGSFAFKLAGHALLLVQFLNIYSLYGEQPPWLGNVLRRTFSNGTGVVYSLISLACFALIIKTLWPRSPSRRSA